MKIAFITGITGQDGSYLCEFLLDKGYTVHGLVHRPNAIHQSNIAHLAADTELIDKRLFLHPGAFEDITRLRRIIDCAQPDEFYHLASQSSPRLSLELPEATVESAGMATMRLLEILRDLAKPPKFLNASSSEVFGSPAYSPQNEFTPLNPTTPYGAAKAFSQQMVRIYRIAYKLPMCSAILYNHESTRRGSQFVTMKVCRSAARIKLGLEHKLKLGNLAGKRDWGWAPDFVRGMWLMLQGNAIDDFILATGKLHSVEDLVATAFQYLDLQWQDHVDYDHKLITAVEPLAPCGNPGKAKNILGWENTVPFTEIIQRLVQSEYDKARKETVQSPATTR